MRSLPILLLAAWAAAPAAAQQAPDLFTRPDKGHCIACHQVPALASTTASRNDVGPALEGERMRALGKEKLKEIIDDAPRLNPDSVMPPYGRHRILEAAEIARLVEFLHALP